MRTLLLLAAGLFMTGCAREPAIPIPGLNHPANPDAAEAPVPPLPSLGAAPPPAEVKSTPMGAGDHMHGHMH